MRTPKITPILSLSCALAAAAPLAAATYVMPSDEALADQAPVIATVRVADAGPAPARAGIATDYVVEVEEVVKGDLPGSTVVVRVPGGEAEGGLALRVSGAPRFASGERALLFLVPNRDGSYGVLHLFLGAFHADRADHAGGRTLVRRDLAEGRPLGPAADPPRDLERFGRWLADRAAGLAAERDYLVAEPAPRAAAEAFSALPTPDRVPLRWFRFDGGESAAWRINAGGVPLDAAAAALRAGIAAWNDDPTSAIAYAYAGSTGASAGFARSDGVNAVLFDDPGGVHVPGSYRCGTGGVVALGVAYFYSATRGHGGRSYHEIVEGDVVTNDGSACFFRDNPAGAAEALAHELGHTLGLGHSAERQALMHGVSSGKRGARLEHDDRLGAHALYGLGAAPPQAQAAPRLPAAPAGLAARPLGPSEVELTWRDLSDNEEQFRLEQKAGKAWREVLVLPAGATRARLAGLRPGTTATYRVSARNAAGASPASPPVTVRTPLK